MCRWCVSRIQLDLDFTVAGQLEKLPKDVRAVLLPEIVEEFTAHALGADEALTFLRDCFVASPSVPWFLTQPGSDEHNRLWELAADAPD